MDTHNIISLLKDKQTLNEGFKQLIDAYKERLYWHIRRIVITHEDADDVLQNVFIKVFKYIDSFEEQSSLYTWLFRIATNESIDLLKKKRVVISDISEDYHNYVSMSLKADPYFDGDAIQEIVKSAIADLPQKQMLVFNLKYYEHMKYEDMSKVLNTSVGSLKASYHHAVKKVESYIKLKNIQYEF